MWIFRFVCENRMNWRWNSRQKETRGGGMGGKTRGGRAIKLNVHGFIVELIQKNSQQFISFVSTYGQVFKWLSNGKWQMEKQQQNGRSIICMNAPKASIQFWYFLNGNHQNDRKSSEIKSVVREILVIVVWANKNEPSHASDEKAPFALWIKLVIHLNAIHMLRSQMKPYTNLKYRLYLKQCLY